MNKPVHFDRVTAYTVRLIGIAINRLAILQSIAILKNQLTQTTPDFDITSNQRQKHLNEQNPCTCIYLVNVDLISMSPCMIFNLISIQHF